MNDKDKWNAIQQQAMITQVTLIELNDRIHELEKRLDFKEDTTDTKETRSDDILASKMRRELVLNPKLYHDGVKNKLYQEYLKKYEEYDNKKK